MSESAITPKAIIIIHTVIIEEVTLILFAIYVYSLVSFRMPSETISLEMILAQAFRVYNLSDRCTSQPSKEREREKQLVDSAQRARTPPAPACDALGGRNPLFEKH